MVSSPRGIACIYIREFGKISICRDLCNSRGGLSAEPALEEKLALILVHTLSLALILAHLLTHLLRLNALVVLLDLLLLLHLLQALLFPFPFGSLALGLGGRCRGLLLVATCRLLCGNGKRDNYEEQKDYSS